MLDNWIISFPNTISILKKNKKLERSFSIFMQWADANSAPAMGSSGIAPVIRALLEELLDDKGLATLVRIVANQSKPQATSQ
jgi:2-hydroxy-3-keto-5-methylthiopentenyl-1-phosphate phosphatase